MRPSPRRRRRPEGRSASADQPSERQPELGEPRPCLLELALLVLLRQRLGQIELVEAAHEENLSSAAAEAGDPRAAGAVVDHEATDREQDQQDPGDHEDRHPGRLPGPDDEAEREQAEIRRQVGRRSARDPGQRSDRVRRPWQHDAILPIIGRAWTRSPTAREALEAVGYLADEPAALVAYLAQQLGKPVLVEGPAGVGKTELAKAISRATGRELIRLQCYEGLDEAKALYEWNYRKQLLRIQASTAEDRRRPEHRRRADRAASGDELNEIFAEDFLLTRPLLEAIASTEPVVLLIDEIDKTDQEFEAMLLEVLSDFQISIPELGVIEAARTRSSSSPRTTRAS